MPAEKVQTTLTFVSEHEGITLAFLGLLVLLLVYLYKELTDSKKATRAAQEDSTATVIEGLQTALELQRDTIDSTLAKLDSTVGKLEKTITDLAAELFRDMHSLDRRLSKLEGEHNAHLRLRRLRKEDNSEGVTECLS